MFQAGVCERETHAQPGLVLRGGSGCLPLGRNWGWGRRENREAKSMGLWGWAVCKGREGREKTGREGVGMGRWRRARSRALSSPVDTASSDPILPLPVSPVWWWHLFWAVSKARPLPLPPFWKVFSCHLHRSVALFSSLATGPPCTSES